MLPEGLYDTAIEEIRTTMGFTRRRLELIDGLVRYLDAWDRQNLLECTIIDGSFVTDKPEPGDIDILLVPTTEGLRSMEYANLVLELCLNRDETKERYGCEAFPVLGSDSQNYREWYTFFSTDRHGNKRGLLRVNLPL